MANFTDTPRLTNRFNRALDWVADVHFRQVRKDKKETPYIAHIMAVASLALENNADEPTAIAALLHDSLEDIEDVTVKELIEEFGKKVADLVMEVTEDSTLEDRARKINYAERIAEGSPEAALISACDKLHNLRCYLQNRELLNDEVLWFYRLIFPVYQQRLGFGHQIVKEMYQLYERAKLSE